VHPYRTAPPAEPAEPRERPPAEEWALAGGLALIGGVRVIAALVQSEPFATEATIALLMFVVGAVYLVRLLRTAPS
jgi:hypothetical protein